MLSPSSFAYENAVPWFVSSSVRIQKQTVSDVRSGLRSNIAYSVVPAVDGKSSWKCRSMSAHGHRKYIISYKMKTMKKHLLSEVTFIK